MLWLQADLPEVGFVGLELVSPGISPSWNVGI